MTDYELHTQAMQTVEYSNHHNKMFHGPGWLNISAMQMCAEDKPEETFSEKRFSPTVLYNIFLSDELDFGTPLHKMLNQNQIQDLFNISRESLSWLMKGTDKYNGKISEMIKKYKIIEAGRTAVEWNIGGELYYSNESVMRAKSVNHPQTLRDSLAKGTFRGEPISRRYVVLDLSGNVLEELV